MHQHNEGCKFLSKCPLWDISSRGQEWCEGTPIDYNYDSEDYEWERCPKPKKRKKAVEENKKEKSS